MCLRSPKPPPPPKIPEPRPPAPAPEETAAAPVLGKKRTSQQTPTKKEGAVTSRTGTAAVISRRRLGTSSLRIPLLTDLNTPV